MGWDPISSIVEGGEKLTSGKIDEGLWELGTLGLGKGLGKQLSGYAKGDDIKGAQYGQAPVGPTTPAPTVQGPKGPYTATDVKLPVQGPNVTTANLDPNKTYGQSGTIAQEDLLKALMLQSQGQGPSLATDTLQRGSENNLNAVMAQLASARGGANPLMQRSAMNAYQDIQAETARDAATARVAEQLQAQQQAAGLASGIAGQGLTERGQDIGLATTNAGFQNAADMAKFGLEGQAALQNASAANTANSQWMDVQTKIAVMDAELASRRDELMRQYASMGMQIDVAQAQADAAVAAEKRARTDKIIQGVVGGVGDGLAAYASGGTSLAAKGATNAAVNNASPASPTTPAGSFMTPYTQPWTTGG